MIRAFPPLAATLLVAPLLMALPTSAAARDYGQRGAVFPVIERDLLEQIHARLKTMEASGETGRLNQELIRLIEAMASDGVLPEFKVRAEFSRPRRTGGLEVQQVAAYDGPTLTGLVFTLRNIGAVPVDLAGSTDAPAGALAFAYARDVLAPGETARAFLVFTRGGLE